MILPDKQSLKSSLPFYTRRELDQLLFTIIENSTGVLEQVKPLILKSTDSTAINSLVENAIDYNNTLIDLIEDYMKRE